MSRHGAGIIALALVTLAGCATPVVGLRPVYAPLPRDVGKPAEPEMQSTWWIGWVDSVQPTLEWETFPRQSDAPLGRERITDVTYDLRIWLSLRADDPSSVVLVDLVYSREGLTTPRHRLEEPLLPRAEYVWTVRARYELDGMPRSTPWGGREPQARLPVEPNPWRYRFTTPIR
jgi:hypothetical protein